MHDENKIPCLTFPMLPKSEASTPHDLRRLLYWQGKPVNRKEFLDSIKNGRAGQFFPERVEVVIKIHEFIEGKLVAGGSPESTKNYIYRITSFFDWASQLNLSITLSSLEKVFLKWAEHLYNRWKVVKNLAQSGAYSDARTVGSIIDYILGRNRCIVLLTRLRKPAERKSPQGRVAENQNLKDTIEFGHLLHDICDGLSLSVINKISIQIPLRTGGSYSPWTGGSKKRTKRRLPNWEKLDEEKRKEDYEKDSTDRRRGRRAVINLRINAELLIFIAETGMNLAQAHNLKLRQYTYASDIDGYKVLDYKKRRQGEVLFEIHKEYRAHFERYLAWRRTIFPNNERLFPIIREGSLETTTPTFALIKRVCEETNVQWIPPNQLRSTKVNWLLRRSGDPDLTAEVAQHQKKTLLNVYERPSLHRALGEVTRFWLTNDPTLSTEERLISVAPGQCNGKPSPVPSKPVTAPSPDCLKPSGCLWCEHHRDIDTQDYVWSLASFRYLKTIEVSKHHSNREQEEQGIPAQHTVNRLSEKLTWFKESNPKRKNWVEVALSRVEARNYHSEWFSIIIDIE